MDNKPKKKTAGFFAGKGFYIALFLCVAAIGISGYLLFFSGNSNVIPEANQINDTDQTADTQTPAPEKLPAIKDVEEKTDTPAKTPTVPQKEEPRKEDTVQTVPAEPAPQAKEEPVKQTSWEPAVQPVNDDGYHLPIKGAVRQEHSLESLVYSPTLGDWRTHSGMDILAEAGAPVTAAAKGEVISVVQDDALGNCVTIRHADGMSTVYANLSPEVCVQEGWQVKTGEVIGFVGTSALSESAEEPHLHFEMFFEGQSIDPREILSFE